MIVSIYKLGIDKGAPKWLGSNYPLDTLGEELGLWNRLGKVEGKREGRLAEGAV